jgi:AcrR family transcriptional regulator
MIVDAAIEVVRRQGFENINARTVSGQLHCSTQPVMYHFSTIENLKKAVYMRADQLHTEYLMNIREGLDPILGIGINYIRFAVEEPQLFRFLFQSGYAEGGSLMEMVDSGELLPVLAAMQQGSGLSAEKTKEVFITVAMFAHGYASIIANNHLEYDEKLIAEHLERTWSGAVLAAARRVKKHRISHRDQRLSIKKAKDMHCRAAKRADKAERSHQNDEHFGKSVLSR